MSESSASGSLLTRTGNKLISDKSIKPTKMQPAAIVGPTFKRNSGDFSPSFS